MCTTLSSILIFSIVPTAVPCAPKRAAMLSRFGERRVHAALVVVFLWKFTVG